MNVNYYELEFSQNEYYGNKECDNYFIVEGSNNVIISVPHCYKHFRNNIEKVNEFMTGAFGKYVQKITDCHLIYSGKYLEADPNWDEISPYRDALNEYILSNKKINFLIDLHGTKDQKYDLVIGVNNMININHSCNYLNIVKKYWNNLGYKVGIDYIFKASGKNNICKNANEKTNIHSLQFEISNKIRINNEKSQRFADALSEFVKMLERLITCSKIIVSKRNESMWPLNYVLISKTYAERHNLIDNTLISLKNEKYEIGSELTIVIDESIEDNTISVSQKTKTKLEKLGLGNESVFMLIECSSIKYIYKIDADLLDDDTIFVNSELFKKLKENKVKYVKILNPIFNINSSFKYLEYNSNIERSNSIWINYKNRNLLGIEVKSKYSWHEYIRIIKLLSNESFMAHHEDKKYLLVYFEKCYSLENNKIYSLLDNPYQIMSDNLGEEKMMYYSLNNVDIQQLSYKIRIDFKKLFSIVLMGSSISPSAKTNLFADSLVGLSRVRLILIKSNDYLEGTNNVKINSLTASILDVKNNERIIIYNGKKSTSCRVILDDQINDMELPTPKNIRSKLGINQDNTIVSVKRDNYHIIFKKIDTMILSILLTLFTILTFFKDVEFEHYWIIIISVLLISLLIITSNFTERRKNVK